MNLSRLCNTWANFVTFISCLTSLLRIPNTSEIEKKNNPKTTIPTFPKPQPKQEGMQQYSLVEDFQNSCYSKQKRVTLKLERKYSHDFATLILSLSV